ncbi:MAG TPA: hypothetical protein P5307_00745 [Pirellulaceae bacterium]|nr:hypothetical protein [Pirellulaceae bacterium]
MSSLVELSVLLGEGPSERSERPVRLAPGEQWVRSVEPMLAQSARVLMQRQRDEGAVPMAATFAGPARRSATIAEGSEFAEAADQCSVAGGIRAVLRLHVAAGE